VGGEGVTKFSAIIGFKHRLWTWLGCVNDSSDVLETDEKVFNINQNPIESHKSGILC
jgi:hypothetical protein